MLGEVHDGLESEIYVGHAGKKNWENRRENKTEWEDDGNDYGKGGKTDMVAERETWNLNWDIKEDKETGT